MLSILEGNPYEVIEKVWRRLKIRMDSDQKEDMLVSISRLLATKEGKEQAYSKTNISK